MLYLFKASHVKLLPFPCYRVIYYYHSHDVVWSKTLRPVLHLQVALIAVDGKIRPEWQPPSPALQGEENVQQQHQQHQQQQQQRGGGRGEEEQTETKSNGLLHKLSQLSRSRIAQSCALPRWYRRQLSGDVSTQIPHTKMVTQVTQSISEAGQQPHPYTAGDRHELTSPPGPSEKTTISTACTTFRRPYPVLGGGVILARGFTRPGTPMPLQVSSKPFSLNLPSSLLLILSSCMLEFKFHAR